MYVTVKAYFWNTSKLKTQKAFWKNNSKNKNCFIIKNQRVLSAAMKKWRKQLLFGHPLRLKEGRKKESKRVISQICFLFLDASTYFYMRVCPSIGPSVGPSVHPAFFLIAEFEWKRHINHWISIEFELWKMSPNHWEKNIWKKV